MNKAQNLPLLRSLAIATLVLLLDQLSKWSALSNLKLGIPEEVLPFMNWLLLFNPGAAFSFLAQSSGWQRWFFTILGLAASLYILWLLRKNQSDKMLSAKTSLTKCSRGPLALFWAAPLVMFWIASCMERSWILSTYITATGTGQPSILPIAQSAWALRSLFLVNYVSHLANPLNPIKLTPCNHF